MDHFVRISGVTSLVRLAFIGYLISFILSKPQGNETMARLSRSIQKGAMAFLLREYRYVLMTVLVLAVLIAVVGESRPDLPLGWKTSIAFLIGALASEALDLHLHALLKVASKGRKEVVENEGVAEDQRLRAESLQFAAEPRHRSHALHVTTGEHRRSDHGRRLLSGPSRVGANGYRFAVRGSGSLCSRRGSGHFAEDLCEGFGGAGPGEASCVL